MYMTANKTETQTDALSRPVIMADGRPLQIAVDGTAASGKGTLGRKLADRFGLRYLDTGAIYRAAAFLLLQEESDPQNEEAAVRAAGRVKDGMPARDLLYCEGVGAAASIISAYPRVREELLCFQRDVAQAKEGAILDGRDIGTVICPDAHVKLFVTASLEARARRRFKQLQSEDSTVIFERILEDLRRRDERDSNRAACPLTQAEDAVALDTTHMNAAEAYEAALLIVQRAVGAR